MILITVFLAIMLALAGCGGLIDDADRGTDESPDDAPADINESENGTDGPDNESAERDDTDEEAAQDEDEQDTNVSDEQASADETGDEEDEEEETDAEHESDGADEEPDVTGGTEEIDDETNESDDGEKEHDASDENKTDSETDEPADSDTDPDDNGTESETDTSTLTVEVVTDDTGEPIESEVRLRGPADDPGGLDESEERTLSTGEDGTVTFEDLDDGYYEVYADPVDYDVNNPGVYFWKRIEIDGADVTTTHELPPAPRDHTLTFEVTDNSTGEPIEDAAVEVFFVYIWNGAEIGKTEQTDATGTATVDVVNTVVNYEVDAPGYKAESDHLEVNENQTVDVALDPDDPDTHTLTVHVIDKNTAPLPSEVTISDPETGDVLTAKDTGENGIVTFELTDGEYHVRADPGYEISEDLYPGEVIQISGSDETVMHEVPTIPDRRTVTITVTDRVTGDGIENASVVATGSSAINDSVDVVSGTTNERGEATLDLTPGTYEVEVEAYGYFDETRDIDGETTIMMENDPEIITYHPYLWVEQAGPTEEQVWNIGAGVQHEPPPNVADETTFAALLESRDVRGHELERSGDVLTVTYVQPETAGPTDGDWAGVTEDMGAVAEAYWGWYRQAPETVPEEVRVEVYGEDDELLLSYHIELGWVETFDDDYHQTEHVGTYPGEEFVFTVYGAIETHIDQYTFVDGEETADSIRIDSVPATPLESISG